MTGVRDEALEPEQARSLNTGLRKVGDTPGASAELKEMAAKLLSGRVSLRDLVDDPSGSAALGAGLAAQRGQWESASEEERDGVRDAAGRGQESGGDDRNPGGNPGGGRHRGGFSLY